MKTWIVVNRHKIRRNTKGGTVEPPIRLTRGKYGKPKYAYQIAILGPSEVIYNASEPVLPCGARLAISTEAEVVIRR